MVQLILQKKKQLFADDTSTRNQQYKTNKKKFPKYLDNEITKELLYYKNPKKAHWCECGWIYSTKDKERIAKHERWCPIKSPYGIVPALPPLRSEYESNMVDAIKSEFDGYTKRLNNEKCMFNLQGRSIQFDNTPSSLEPAPIRDVAVIDTIKKYEITSNAAKQRKAEIVYDLGHGWIEIYITYDDYTYPGKRIIITNKQYDMPIRRIVVMLKELKWKGQSNIWVVDPNKYQLDWKLHQY